MDESKRKDIENFVKRLYEDGSSPCEAFGVTLDQLAELEEAIEEAKERMRQHSDKTIDEFKRQIEVPYPEDLFSYPEDEGE